MSALLPIRVNAAPTRVVCDDLVASPTVERDRTLFCIWSSGGAITISSSEDLGRTWRTYSPSGFLAADDLLLNDVVLSPDYVTDRTLFVQTATALYVSTDRGESVSLVDPLAGGYSLLPALTGLRTAPSAAVDLPVLPGVLLAHARQADPPEIVQPPLHSAAPGAAGPLDTFLVAPAGTGRYAGTVLGVGRERYVPGVTGPSYRAALYACDAALSCPTMLGTTEYGGIVRDASVATDFARSGLAFLYSSGKAGSRLWIARDGGRSLALASSAQRYLDQIHRAGGHPRGARIANDPSRPGRLYLRVGMAGDRAGIPAEQMFVSHDDGRTWTRIGYARRSSKPFVPGPRGWPGAAGISEAGSNNEPMLVLGDGRIVLIGDDGTSNRVYCSTDGARSWQATCVR